MKKRCLSIGLTALSLLSILMLTLYTVQSRVNVSAASPPPKTLAGYIPTAVTSGQARLIGQHAGTDQLALAIGLPLRNEQALTHLLNEVSTPRNPHYRHYLSQAQANQAFNPTPQQEQQVISWMKSHGLTVTHTYPNHLLVDVTGTFAQIEQVFHVTINDFTMQLEGKQTTFYAPSNEPTVDGSVSNVIDSILGLDDYPRFHVDAPLAPTYPATNGNAHGFPPYYPHDFANAYDVNPLWNAGDTGVGQHIGIVLWGPPPSSAALQQFDAQTGATPPNLQLILVKGGSKYPVSPDGAKEAAMDVETTSGMAPGATINYYEAPDTPKGNATASGLEAALNMAGTDPINNQQISNSWHRECEPTQEGAFIKATEQILLSNSATGHNYFFSSGDSGSSCGGTNPLAQYPATSAYVTSVGGTHFSKNIAGGYRQETAWSGSGGGYSILFLEPHWQANASIPDPNAMRGLPDVAADAAQSTGAFICYDSSNGPTCTTSGDPQSYGRGTSLATPLWAGMMADVNQYVRFQGELPLGFITPLLYEMSNGSPYTAFHDIMNGTNGHYYQAGPSWDAVTGLGSPDLYNLALDAASLDAYNSNLSGVAAVSANDIWAVGDSWGLSLIEHWNGTSWSVVPSPGLSNNSLNSVTVVTANNIWAVGNGPSSTNYFSTLIEHWNGSSWNVVPSPNSSSYGNNLTGVAAVAANDIWAVGYYYDSNNDIYTLIEHWNGTSWGVVPSPNPGPPSPWGNVLSGVAAVAANDIWAVGTYFDSNEYEYTLIEHWNGTSWSVVPSPGNSLALSSVAAVSANDIWAVGSNYNSTLIEHWNGTSWSVVPSPNPISGSYGINLSSVAAVSANDIWAVGYYHDTQETYPTLIEHWNGTSWSVVPSPNPAPYGNFLSSVAAVSANDIWAVGFSDDTQETSLTLVEHWNGTSWSVVPSPNPPNPYALGKR